MEHGKTAYANGCRCDVCRAWQRDKSSDDRRRLKARVAAGDPTLVHGRATLYSKGKCRCGPCSEAAASAARKWRADNPERNAEQVRRWRESHPEQISAYVREQNDLAGLPRKDGFIWTGAELEIIVTRTDLSLTELARLLGRTRNAVAVARHRATTDPKWIRVVGVSGMGVCE